jgi:hypothetical protein
MNLSKQTVFRVLRSSQLNPTYETISLVLQHSVVILTGGPRLGRMSRECTSAQAPEYWIFLSIDAAINMRLRSSRRALGHTNVAYGRSYSPPPAFCTLQSQELVFHGP